MNEIRDMEKQACVVEQLIENHDKAVVRANKQIQAPIEGPYTVEQLSGIEAASASTRLNFLRGHIAELGDRVLHFRTVNIVHACNIGEARANITLAYRHLEDARMRLGKAIASISGDNQQSV